MIKIVVLRLSNMQIELWTDLGQSPSSINMGGNEFLGYTNDYINARSDENLKEAMQKDINNKDCFKWGNGSLRDWAIAKYNIS